MKLSAPQRLPDQTGSPGKQEKKLEGAHTKPRLPQPHPLWGHLPQFRVSYQGLGACPVYPHQKLDWSASRLEARLAEAPDDKAARLELARLYLSRGLYHGGGELQCSTALHAARRLLQDDPESVDALIIAGTALIGMDRTETAQKYLDEALKLDASRPDLHMALGAMYRAQGDRSTALRHLELAVRGSPNSWEVHLLLGRTLSEHARRTGESRLSERAQYHLVQALKIGPPPELLHPLMRDLGLLCLQTGRYAEAEKLFVRLRENPKFSVITRKYLGQVACGLGKYKNGVQHFRHYLDEHPDDAGALSAVGQAYLQLGEIEKARESCEKALLLDSHLLSARHTLGCTFLEEKLPQDALRIFKDTLQEHPEDMTSYIELARTRRGMGDIGWLQKALHAEVASHDCLPFGGSPNSPRTFTRRRIGVLLDELRAVGPTIIPTVLAAVDLSDDEGLRFSLWEAACNMAQGHVADQVAARLKESGRTFSVGLARNAMAAAAAIPEPALTAGLSVTVEDVQRAAVERRGNASDLNAHRRILDAEREHARAYQAVLLLSIASRKSRSARQLLQNWSTQADPELNVAVQVGQAMLGDADASRALSKRAQERGASAIVERLLSQVSPPVVRADPKPISDGRDVHCSVCGRTTGGDCTHLMAGTRSVLCNVCVGKILAERRNLTAPDAATCDLCGRSHFEARGLYRYGGGARPRVDVCSECLDLSSGLLERDDVERFLANW